jgi:hypothetical protein
MTVPIPFPICLFSFESPRVREPSVAHTIQSNKQPQGKPLVKMDDITLIQTQNTTSLTTTMLLSPPSKSAGNAYRRDGYMAFQFPRKLHAMLDNAAEIKGFASIVSWLPDSNSFKVHDQAAFVSRILPHYFKQTRYKSFQRQLNIWGFERITKSGAGQGGYRHDSLVRTKPSLCRCMKRIKDKGTRAMFDKQLRLVSEHITDFQGSIDSYEPNACCHLSSSSWSKPQTTGDRHDVMHAGRHQQDDEHLEWSESRQFHQIFGTEGFDKSSVEPQDLKYLLIGLEWGRKLGLRRKLNLGGELVGG